MGFTIKENKAIRIFIAKNECESVLCAVNDLISDIYKKVACKVKLVETIDIADIIVCSANNSEFNTISNKRVELSHSEEFCYIIEDNKIYFFGAEDLGTMWSIYSFSENELKIPPYYYFDDIEFETQKELVIDNKTVSEYPETKFRGWFINDEDLLGSFMSKGKRDIDYAFYKDIIHPDLMEKIVETALRFRINLLIPSTLIDIYNPDEENLVKIISRRGLYVSQHHIEPMGVSHFAFDKFAKNNGCNNLFSFIQNRETMVACWKYYAKKWVEYPRVVWQLGLRGGGDKPVWLTDKNVGYSSHERGKLISEAIATQYEIISSLTDKPIYSTSTVWMEGAKLLQSGDLILPRDTVSVFADIGMTQLFGDDFFNVTRERDRRYGIYYHSQYWHTGPHLAEGVCPEKINYVYELAREYKSNYYAVLNVGNVKEFTFSIKINTSLMWYGGAKKLEDIIDEYCETFAEKNKNEMKNCIEEYFNAFGEINLKYYKNFCEKYNFNYHEYDGLSFPVLSLNDGIVCFVGRCIPFEEKCSLFSQDFYDEVKSGFKKMQSVSEKMLKLSYIIPRNNRNAFMQRWYYQAVYWVNLFGFAIENCKAITEFKLGNIGNISNYYLEASKYIKNIIALRKQVYKHKWADWFVGDKKLDIISLYEFCLEETERFNKLNNIK